jgi:glutathione S-transferase
MKTVYGRATSSNVQAVMWCLGELELHADRLDFGMDFGGLDTAEFRAMNPNMLVPVLRDGALVLWESAAIVRYLAAEYGNDGFWPANLAHRARLDMWAEWIKTTFGPAFNGRVFWPLLREPDQTRDAAALARAVAEVKPLAERLDARIGRGPWMDGETFSWADILCGYLLYRYFTLDFDRADTPALAAYYDRLCQRPMFERHVMVSYEPLRVRD